LFSSEVACVGVVVVDTAVVITREVVLLSSDD
jgi:hypothetical protein